MLFLRRTDQTVLELWINGPQKRNQSCKPGLQLMSFRQQSQPQKKQKLGTRGSSRSPTLLNIELYWAQDGRALIKGNRRKTEQMLVRSFLSLAIETRSHFGLERLYTPRQKQKQKQKQKFSQTNPERSYLRVLFQWLQLIFFLPLSSTHCSWNC